MRSSNIFSGQQDDRLQRYVPQKDPTAIITFATRIPCNILFSFGWKSPPHFPFKNYGKDIYPFNAENNIGE